MQRAWLEFFYTPILLVVGVLFSIVLVVDVGKSNSFADARAAVLSSLLALPKTSQNSLKIHARKN